MSRSLTSTLFRATRASATGRAARRNRLPQRYANKVVGRQAGKIFNRLFWR
jgi:hypothetical protein